MTRTAADGHARANGATASAARPEHAPPGPVARGPLAGIRVVEFAGIGPAPFAAMLLADLGADVVRIDRPGPGGAPAIDQADTTLRTRTVVAADLKDQEARDRVRDLVDRADVLVEGFRPGVMERLGLGPADLSARNPRLVYARMTGWGQTGPWAERVGHDLNYLSITGMLHAIGPADRPAVPLNLVADYGGGAMFLVTGVLAALVERGVSGRGQVVDTAMVDGVGQLSHVFRAMLADGRWHDERAANLLDGGTPYYDVYACADGRHVAVAPLEAPFYRALIAGLGDDLDPAVAAFDDAARLDPANWPAMRAAFTDAFGRRSRDDWTAVFDGTDACVTPVLAMAEAPRHPHLDARGWTGEWGGHEAPAPAPRLSRSGAARPEFPPRLVGSTAEFAELVGRWDAAAPSTRSAPSTRATAVTREAPSTPNGRTRA
ncbi:CaiB/BaiF CoA transferase family protein [Agromyces sp. NPDC058110]|uniref:CaiB/BaiF CoA transferase family protein n=1 Tax=Agromyces sp. NPDC058110 TaxID=3346345 RepID=UPI0036DD9739